MKIFFMSMVLMASTGSFAQAILEFDEATEIKCFSEAEKLGCVTSGGEEKVSCIEAKKARLSKQCRDMHQSKKNSK